MTPSDILTTTAPLRGTPTEASTTMTRTRTEQETRALKLMRAASGDLAGGDRDSEAMLRARLDAARCTLDLALAALDAPDVSDLVLSAESES